MNIVHQNILMYHVIYTGKNRPICNLDFTEWSKEVIGYFTFQHIHNVPHYEKIDVLLFLLLYKMYYYYY